MVSFTYAPTVAVTPTGVDARLDKLSVPDPDSPGMVIAVIPLATLTVP